MAAHRYWRVSITHRGFLVSSGQNGARLSEIELHSASGNVTALATGSATPAQTSGSPPSALYDGNIATETFWSHGICASITGNPRITFDFGSPIEITGVRLGAHSTPGDWPYYIRVQWSDDGTAWHFAAFFVQPPYPGGDAYTSVLPIPQADINARSWRVSFPKMPSGNDGVMIGDVEFYDENGDLINAQATKREGDAGSSGGGTGSSDPAQGTDGNAATHVYWNATNTTSLINDWASTSSPGPGVQVVFATVRKVSKIRLRAPDYSWANQYWPPLIRVCYWDGDYGGNKYNWYNWAEFENIAWPGQLGASPDLELQPGAPAEYPADFSAVPVPFAFGGYARAGAAIPVEFGRAVRLDASVPIEYRAFTIEVDIAYAATPLEWRAAVAIDPPGISFESLYQASLDLPPLPLALGLSARSDMRVPLQWTGAIAVTVDVPVPVAWSGHALVDFGLPLVPLSWVALVDIEGPILYETAAPVQLDSGLPFETVLAVVADAVVPAGWSGISGFDSAPIHFEHIAPGFADSEIPIETALAVLVDQRMPIEYGGYSVPFTEGSFDAWHMPRRSNVWHVQRTRRVTA